MKKKKICLVLLIISICFIATGFLLNFTSYDKKELRSSINRNNKKQTTKFRDEERIKGLKVNTVKDCFKNFSFMIGDHTFSLKTDNHMLAYFDYNFDEQELQIIMDDMFGTIFSSFWNKEYTKFDTNFEQEITRTYEILEKNKDYYFVRKKNAGFYEQHYVLFFISDNVIYYFDILSDKTVSVKKMKEKLFEAKKLFFTEDGKPIHDESAYLEDQLALLPNDFHLILKDSSLIYSVSMSGINFDGGGTIHLYSTDKKSKKNYGLWNTYISKDYHFSKNDTMKKIKINDINGIYSINEKDEFENIRIEQNPNQFFTNASIQLYENYDYEDVKTEKELMEVLNYYFYNGK